MTEPAAPLPSHAQQQGSMVLYFGAVLGRAVAGALACTLPAMLRVSTGLEGSAPAFRAWAGLVAAALGPMGLSLLVLPRARKGLRLLVPSGGFLLLFGALFWLAMLFVSLAMFGALLRATTHHRALAGVTYAFGACGLAVGWAAVSARVVSLLRGLKERTRRLAVGGLSAAAFASVAYLAVRFLRAVSKDESSSAALATVVDVLAFVLAAGVASVDWRAARRPFAIVGPPVAVFLAAFGFTTLRDPSVRQAIDEHAPAFSAPASLISGR